MTYHADDGTGDSDASRAVRVEQQREISELRDIRRRALLPAWYWAFTYSASVGMALSWVILAAITAGHDGGRIGVVTAVWIAAAAVMTLVAAVAAAAGMLIRVILKLTADSDRIAEWRYEEEVHAREQAAHDAGYWRGFAEALKDASGFGGSGGTGVVSILQNGRSHGRGVPS